MKAKFIRTISDLNKFLSDQIESQNFLYEGLIKSYSVQDTIQYFANNIKVKNIKNIKYFLLNESDNNALPYIAIHFVKNYSLELGKQIISWFKVCGWELASTIDNNDINHKDNINIVNIKYYVFRAKFDVQVPRKNWPKILYHLSPLSKQDKIVRKGLIPKAESKLLKHEDAVYLFDAKEEQLDVLAKMLSNKSEKKEKEYSVYKIETENLPAAFILFADPDLKNSYFTKDNISTNAFSLEKNITI